MINSFINKTVSRYKILFPYNFNKHLNPTNGHTSVQAPDSNRDDTTPQKDP